MPEELKIDYQAAIEHCYKTLRHAQGTGGCIAFAKGAEWMRDQVELNRRAQSALNTDMVQVPRKALRWLFGEEGEFVCPESSYFRGKAPAYWWRGVFREMIAHEPAQPEPAATVKESLTHHAAPSAAPTAAPAILMSAVFVKEGTDDFAPQRLIPSGSAVYLAPPSAPSVAPEPLKGWKLNHVQFVRGSGKAEIGYLDPEDDRFSPIVTVDTGLYYEPDQAYPLSVAILEALQAAHPPREASVAPEPPRSAQLMICTGCGRQSDDEPIKPQALACCPDNRYRTLRELLSEIDTLRRVHPPRAPLTSAEIDKAISTSRDALLDHIFEHGTTAEGIASRFREVARAVEAAHGIRGQG